MEEYDIRALSCWRHGEPNFKEDVLRHTAMDRILSNCFVESQRVQNLFNTAARPWKPQRDVVQQESQPHSNVYVPGGRVSVDCSQSSALSTSEQKEFLRLYLVYKHKGKSGLHKQEESVFHLLHKKVVEENVQYEEFVHALMLKKEDVSSIADSIVKYTSSAWERQLAVVDEYPALYKVIATLPLVDLSLDGSLVRFKLENTLLQLGKLPVISPPLFKSKLCCNGEYEDLCHDYPVQSSVSKMCPVSKDATAERLAVAHGADVVVSSSALLHLADNYPLFDRVWDIPVVIRQVQCGDEAGCTKKVIFIDKVLPTTSLTMEQRKLWFCKIAVKKMFCRQSTATAGAKCPAKRPKSVANKLKRGSVAKGPRGRTAGEAAGDWSGSEASSHGWEDVEGACDESVKDDCSALMSQAGGSADADSSASEGLCEGELHGVKRKQADMRGSSGSDHEGSDVSSSDQEDKLVIACGEESMACTSTVKMQRLQSAGGGDCAPCSCEHDGAAGTGGQADSKESVACTSAVKKQRDCAPRSCEHDGAAGTAGQADSKESVACTSAVKKQRLQSTGGEDYAPRSCEHDGAAGTAGQADSKEEQVMTAGENTQVDNQPHLQYSLWHLCLQECEKEDLKERILKQKVKNKHLRMLVRCKVDGVQRVGGKRRQLCIVPKLEYKPEYGAERLSTSEMIRSWLTLYLRPRADLARVRIDAKTSEVLMFEDTSLKEILEYASCSKFAVQSVALGTLYTVLTALDNYAPGTYLLSHRKDCFFNLLQADAENGRYDLHSVYKVNCREASVSRRPQYLPVDPAVVMPRNVLCNRVPATFNPKKQGNRGKRKKKHKNKNK